MVVIFGTGHRPEDAGISFDHMVDLIVGEVVRRGDRDMVTMISGMAAGFDLAFGVAADQLQVPLWCAKPWAGHKPRIDDRDIYEYLENYASRIISVIDAWTYPGSWVYQKRNEWMVDNGDEGIALWNGKRSGGTFNCLEYASEVNKHVTNIYPYEKEV